jgi:hypothetical protein
MKPEEIELQILLSEKEHANHQISSYIELQLKLVAFLFGTSSAALGFVLAKKDNALDPREMAIAILVACVAGCVVMLQSIITYGIALGSIYYKKSILGPRLGELAGLIESPLLAVRAFTRSPARAPVFLATALLTILHFIGTASLLVYAACLAPAWRWSFVAGCWALLALTATIEALLALAMKRVGTD